MRVGRRLKLSLIATLTCITLFMIVPVSMADCNVVVVGNHTWDLIQAYSKAMQEQEAWNKRYLVPGLAILLLLSLGIGIIWRLTHKKPDDDKNKYTGWW